MRRTIPWANLALLLASALLCFLVLELAARTVSYRAGKGFWSRPNAFISPFFVTYDHPPPIFEVQDGEQVGLFRDGRRIPVRKAPGELRVVCLGGSTTVNARNAERLTYSGLTQKAVQEQMPEHKVRVLNGAADAFSTAQSLTNLTLRLLDFEPDVVTIYHAVNDISAQHFGEWLQPDYANKYLDDAFLSYEHRSGIGGAIFRFSRGMQMVKWRLTVLRQMLEHSSRGSGVGNPQQGLAIFERNLRSMAAVARAHGAVPIFITQAHRDGDDGEQGRQGLFNQRIRDLGQELDVTVVDVAAVVGGRTELFLDRFHFTSDGVRAVAAELSPVVAQELQRVATPALETDGSG